MEKMEYVDNEIKRIVSEIGFSKDTEDTISKFKKYVNLLSEKIQILEKELSTQVKPKSDLDRKPHAEEIIDIEIKRLHERVIGGEELDRDDMKKFDTLVKDLVALRSKEAPQPKKSKEKQKSLDELLSIVSSEIDNEE